MWLAFHTWFNVSCLYFGKQMVKRLNQYSIIWWKIAMCNTGIIRNIQFSYCSIYLCCFKWNRVFCCDLISAEGKYREAMKQYLEIGAMTSNMFSKPVPFHAWDEQVSIESLGIKNKPCGGFYTKELPQKFHL